MRPTSTLFMFTWLLLFLPSAIAQQPPPPPPFSVDACAHVSNSPRAPGLVNPLASECTPPCLTRDARDVRLSAACARACCQQRRRGLWHGCVCDHEPLPPAPSSLIVGTLHIIGRRAPHAPHYLEMLAGLVNSVDAMAHVDADAERYVTRS